MARNQSSLNIGRGMMVVSQLLYSMGSFIADWNETHIYNPTWPGHAKFHNGQTMTISILLTLAVFYYLFRSPILTGTSSAAFQKDSLFTAAVVGSMYCISGLSAITYPGTTWNDPPAPPARPQVWLFPFQLVLNWVGWYVASAGVGGAVVGKGKRG